MEIGRDNAFKHLLEEYSMMNAVADKLNKRASILAKRQFDREFDDFMIKMESFFRGLCKYRLGKIICKKLFGGG